MSWGNFNPVTGPTITELSSLSSVFTYLVHALSGLVLLKLLPDSLNCILWCTEEFLLSGEWITPFGFHSPKNETKYSADKGTNMITKLGLQIVSSFKPQDIHYAYGVVVVVWRCAPLCMKHPEADYGSGGLFK